METQTFKRRQFIVDPAFQLQFTTWLFGAVLAVAITSSLIATGILWSNLYQPGAPHQATFTAAAIAVSTTLLIELLLAIPIIFYVGIRQTHRIVGPINRMKRMIDGIGSGDFSQRITLREGDVLTDLAGALNQMAQHLQERFGKPS